MNASDGDIVSISINIRKL